MRLRKRLVSSCEKCWYDARGDAERYQQLVEERNASGNYCTPEERAGPHARECPGCLRMTLHQHTGQPMCGCAPQREPKP